jgi:hypothetical protein
MTLNLAEASGRDRISKDSRRLFRRCGRRRCSCQHLSVYRKQLHCELILVLTPPGMKAPSIVAPESGTILGSGVVTPGVMRRHSLITAVFSSQLPLRRYRRRHSPRRAVSADLRIEVSYLGLAIARAALPSTS